jgi:hypothetical protein
MNRNLVTIALLFVSTTLSFIEFEYLWDHLTGPRFLYLLALAILVIWSINSSTLYLVLSQIPLPLLNAPARRNPKQRASKEAIDRDLIHSRFSVAQEFTIFGICIATLLWLLRMYFMDKGFY